MNKKLRHINLQLLAGEAEDNTTPDGADDQGNPSGGTDAQDNAETKTFTQEEVDAAIQARLARERKKLPAEKDLKEFQEWKKTQKPPAADDATTQLQRELEETRAKLEAAERKETVLSSKVNPKMAAYVVFEVSKLVDDNTDFDDALAKWLKDNPEFTAAGTETKNETPAGAQGQRHTTPPGKLSGVELEFYKRNPELKPNGG